MDVFTVSQMAQMLGIKKDTAKKRLYYAKIKPLYRDAVYSLSAFETIKTMSQVGRPKKEAGESPPKKPVGRPRKNPPADASPPKKPRGRPRKTD
jgi:hypothetical protein